MQSDLQQAYIDWISSLSTFHIFYTLLYSPDHFTDKELNLIFTTRQLPERMTRDVQRALSPKFLKGVRLYGFAVCELQKSGVPHWHMIIGSPCLILISDYSKMRYKMMRYWKSITGGCWSYYDQLNINQDGTYDALGYCVKYIEKNDAIFSFPFLIIDGKEQPFKLPDTLPLRSTPPLLSQQNKEVKV